MCLELDCILVWNDHLDPLPLGGIPFEEDLDELFYSLSGDHAGLDVVKLEVEGAMSVLEGVKVAELREGPRHCIHCQC